MENIKQQIEALQHWLREHPNAPLEARHDKIMQLAELKEQLENLNKIQNGNS